jgi:hypothetical protein
MSIEPSLPPANGIHPQLLIATGRSKANQRPRAACAGGLVIRVAAVPRRERSAFIGGWPSHSHFLSKGIPVDSGHAG